MARGLLLHGIVAVTASAHSPLPPPLTVVPPPPLPPVPEDGGFSPLPPPRPPSTELGRVLPGSQHDGRQLAHSTTIVSSGSIVGSVTSASLLDGVRAAPEASDIPELSSFQLVVPSHRRELQTQVSNTSDLTSALANTAVGHIVLAPGTYYLISELSITRSVVLEAAVAGSVVLDAQGSFSGQRIVLNINPGLMGVVQVIGLNITGGYMPGGYGGGVWIDSGTVTLSSCTITGNTGHGGWGGGVFVSSGTVTIT